MLPAQDNKDLLMQRKLKINDKNQHHDDMKTSLFVVSLISLFLPDIFLCIGNQQKWLYVGGIFSVAFD